MASLWKLGGLSVKELALRIKDQVTEDDVPGRAAQLAYYFLLSLFPALFFLTAILGFLAEPGGELTESMLGYFQRVMPGSAYKLVERTLGEINASTTGWKLLFGLAGAIWAASNGVVAIMAGLNVAYEVKEGRPWWKARALAIGMTLGLIVLGISAMALMLYGNGIGRGIASLLGLGGVFTFVWNIVQWPLVLLFVLVIFSLLYRFAPDLERLKWVWISPGAVVGVALWLLVSFGFRVYLGYFNSYNEVYGSLGAVIILMLWLWLTGIAILVGGEVNSEIEHAAAEAGQPDARRRGEKRPQLRAA